MGLVMIHYRKTINRIRLLAVKCEEDEGTVCGDGQSTDNEDKQSDSDW